MSYKLFIDGKWKDSVNNKTQHIINPCNEEVAFTTAYADGQDTEEAILSAARAYPQWAAVNPFERSKKLKLIAFGIRENADEYAKYTTTESGKPYRESRGEWLAAADIFEWFSEEAKRTYGEVLPASRSDKRTGVMWQPIGVVGVIAAWNFPIWNLARPVAAAMAAGCTVVIKPSEFTPISAVLLARIVEYATVPNGTLNVVFGDAEAIGKALLQNEAVKKIHFVGSTRVGKHLMDKASLTNTKLSLELGGNAPLIVFNDVDVEKIATEAVKAKFRNNGQVCVSPQRFLVHESIYDHFINVFTKNTALLKQGDGMDDSTDVGPLINSNQVQHMQNLVQEARTQNAKVILGGETPQGTKGYFYSPTVVKDVSPSNALFRKEIFGPIVPFTPFKDMSEAVRLANDTEYGLASYVFTENLKMAVRTCEALEFGMVALNEWTPHGTEAPFGGWKKSGMGTELGRCGIFEYMNRKVISMGGI